MKQFFPGISRKIALLSFPVCILLGLGLAFVYGKLQEKMYSASTVIYIEGNQRDRLEPSFLEKEFGFMRSEEVVLPALRELKSKSRLSPAQKGWESLSEEELYRRLASDIQIRPYFNNHLIELTVFWENAPHSAKLANGIAHSYVKIKNQVKDLSGNGKFQGIQADIRRQSELLEKAEKNVELLLSKNKGPKSRLPKNVRALEEARKEAAGQKALVASLNQTKNSLEALQSPCHIVTEAVANAKPFKPNVKANLITGACVGLFFALVFNMVATRKPR